MKLYTKNIFSIIAVLSLFTITAIYYTNLLFSGKVLGLDGYYYLIQVKSILNTGSVAYKTTSPLVFGSTT